MKMAADALVADPAPPGADTRTGLSGRWVSPTPTTRLPPGQSSCPSGSKSLG